jgi:ornithine cyclodeaminase/alanine dehydrogenase-like protein (mu-crystallin family)
VRILTRSDVERLLDYPSCITAVEAVFRQRASAMETPSGVLGVHVADGGFHVKAAAARIDGRDWFAAKINANFPGNPAAHHLPTIQGMLGLFDATRGEPLALMDSMSVTTIRTAAASAVAAKHLAPDGASALALVGCGVQAAAHVRAIATVRPIRRVIAFDTDTAALRRFAAFEFARLRAEPAGDVCAAVRSADIVVTCTPSHAPFLASGMVKPGAFVAAVGADNQHKSEIEPSFMRDAAVVVDDLEQCATIGDLHHALEAQVVTRADVRATLGEAILDASRVRRDAREVVVFDSTGVAIEDVAAAVLAYARAERTDAGIPIALGA